MHTPSLRLPYRAVHRLWLIALAGVLALAACAPAGRPGGPLRTAPEASPDALIVQVENQGPEGVEVVLLAGTNAISLGFVAGGTYERFSIGRAQFPGRGQVQMIARLPLGSDEYRSPPVVVSEGQGLLLRVGPQLRFSQLMLRR